MQMLFLIFSHVKDNEYIETINELIPLGIKNIVFDILTDSWRCWIQFSSDQNSAENRINFQNKNRNCSAYVLGQLETLVMTKNDRRRSMAGAGRQTWYFGNAFNTGWKSVFGYVLNIRGVCIMYVRQSEKIRHGLGTIHFCKYPYFR